MQTKIASKANFKMKKKIEIIEMPSAVARKGRNAKPSAVHIDKKREAKKRGLNLTSEVLK
jgi:hypothetical protein